jgi:hypothetical protein
MNVPPMPSAHLFINLGEPARLWDSDSSVSPAMYADGWFMGIWTRRFLYEYPRRVRLVGVHFKPWGFVAVHWHTPKRIARIYRFARLIVSVDARPRSPDASANPSKGGDRFGESHR